MVNKCCVPNCKGNYPGTQKLSVFSFPHNEDLKRQWLAAIPRDFKPSSYSKVCELHFAECHIRRTTEYFDENTGRTIMVQLKQPRLVCNTVPSIFPNCPSYLSSTQVLRDSPNKKRKSCEQGQLMAAIADSLESCKKYEEKYCFLSLDELTKCLEATTVPNNWTILLKPDGIFFLNIEVNPAPLIVASVKVDSNLQITAHSKSVIINKVREYIFPFTVKSVHEIFNLLDVLETDVCMSNSNENHISAIQNSLELLEKSVNEEKRKIISFISEQVTLLCSNKHHFRYSHEFLILSCLIFSISPHAYRFLRRSGILTLPHHSTLARLCSSYKANPISEQDDYKFLAYTKQRWPYLEATDKHVILLLDEIHIKPYVDYKGGKILGLDSDHENVATSAHVFMVQSIMSQFKEVVHILPVKTITADILFRYVKKVIIGLEEIGLNVFCVVSDNNAINRKTMSYFADPPKLSIVYPHPFNVERPLFFVIDTVHLLKCIRNNWINQKNYPKSIFYPKFPLSSSYEKNISKLETASLEVVSKLHSFDTDNLVSYGYGLTLKALNPSNLEKQNVKYVLQIFNDFVSEGLKLVGEKNKWPDSTSTAEFIKIISDWFQIMNVKTPFKGEHKCNLYQKPLTIESNDPRITFLEAFLDWLESWEKVKTDTGTFSRETHLALKHSTYAVIEITRYCIQELDLKYVLTGKLQTDSLEDRFGKYRQLAGADYNISLTQLFEVETKLRLQSMSNLALKVSMTIDDANKSDEKLLNDETIGQFLKFVSVNDYEIKKVEPILPVLTYIAGYCIYAAGKKNKCNYCNSIISVDKSLEINENYAFIRNLERGNLKYPCSEVITMIIYNYVVITKLLSDEHKTDFLKVTNHRLLALQITTALLTAQEIFLDVECCPLNHSADYVHNLILWPSTNIILKNYCKNQNDEIRKSKIQKSQSLTKKRKLQTLSKQ